MKKKIIGIAIVCMLLATGIVSAGSLVTENKKIDVTPNLKNSESIKPLNTVGWTEEQCEKLLGLVGFFFGGTIQQTFYHIIALLIGGTAFLTLFLTFGAGLVICAFLYLKNCMENAVYGSTTCPLCAKE